MRKYENYAKGLAVLEKAPGEDLRNEFVISGIVDKFMLQFEMGWKLLQQALRYEGDTLAATGSPRAVLKEAYRCYPFLTENVWLEMLKERNNMAHAYDGEAAKRLAVKIIDAYLPEFKRLQEGLQRRYGEQLKDF